MKSPINCYNIVYAVTKKSSNNPSGTMKERGFSNKQRRLSKRKKIVIFVSILTIVVLSTIGLVFAKIKQPDLKAKQANGPAQSEKSAKQPTAEKKKLVEQKEQKRSETKSRNDKCKNYYEAIDKYTKTLADKNAERSKKIRDLTERYRNEGKLGSAEYSQEVSKINQQYSNMIKDTQKPPTKQNNC